MRSEVIENLPDACLPLSVNDDNTAKFKETVLGNSRVGFREVTR